MYKTVTNKFKMYNGDELEFYYREDTNDYNTILSIINTDEYLTQKMTYGDGDVFVDIGAHIGTWSRVMEHLVPNAQVVAVEPLSENCEFIRKNSKAEVVSKAISNKSSTKTKIYYADDSESGKHHRFVGNMTSFRGKEFIEAETISLNHLLTWVNRVRVMKFDCEGAEFNAIRFASNATLSKIDYMIGEYHNIEKEKGKTRADLFKLTRGLFEDISESHEDTPLGQFWFKRK